MVFEVDANVILVKSFIVWGYSLMTSATKGGGRGIANADAPYKELFYLYEKLRGIEKPGKNESFNANNYARSATFLFYFHFRIKIKTLTICYGDQTNKMFKVV